MNNYQIPRIMIAGTNSGCGKTTVTCAVLKSLANRGLQVSPFKCGPDYIDPMFHSMILNTPSTNLDPFFFSENTMRLLLAKNSQGKEISVIEGVMGFYDGLGFDSAIASSFETAQITQTPVILVLNAKGSALSLLAQIHGFNTFLPDNYIRGIILNRCSPMSYPLMAKAIQEQFQGKIIPLGYLPEMPDSSLESRHLGLVTAQEVSNLSEIIDRLARQAEKSIDLDSILQLAQSAGTVQCDDIRIPRYTKKIRIAAAMDKAFCFYYHDDLDMLKEMGAEIIPFSPLNDRKLPEDIHGLYLGGGYPELYAEALSQNVPIKNEIRKLLEDGIPCIAECGGFMYLTQAITDYPMVGFLSGKCFNTGKLTRFGYIHLKSDKNDLLGIAGKSIPAHEFHYWDCEDPGSDYTAEKPSGKSWTCVHANETLYAGFPHIHFYAESSIAVRFYEACLKYKEKSHA